MLKRVMVLGLNPSWQKSLFFSELVFHEVNRAGKVQSMPSGKGINFVRAARNWGKISSFVLQPVGGYTGDMLREALLAEQLPEISIPTDVPTRICSTLICGKTKTITEIIEPSGRLSEEDVNILENRAAQLLEESDALAVCGTFPPGISPDFYASFIRVFVQLLNLLISIVSVFCRQVWKILARQRIALRIRKMQMKIRKSVITAQIHVF